MSAVRRTAVAVVGLLVLVATASGVGPAVGASAAEASPAAPAVGAGVAQAPAAGPIRHLDQVFPSATVTKDLVYGSAVDDQGATEQLKLDLYRPAGDTATGRPAIVYVHGGGFVAGDKAQTASTSTDLARRGYVVVSIDYRLSSMDPRQPGGPITDQYIQAVLDAQHDAQAAVRWLRANAATYGIDPSRIGITGSSAGAVTALAVGYHADDPGDSGNPGYPSDVKAVVADSGAIGTTLQRPGGAPAMMLNGTADTRALYPEATASCDAATAAHLWCTLVTFPGVAHTVGGHQPALTRSLEASFFHDRLAVGPHVTAPPFPDPVSFVSRQYRDLLLRDADPAGLDHWSSLVAHGALAPADLVAEFAGSHELQGRVGAVTRSYLAYLDRPPDPSGLAYWVGRIRSGEPITSVDASLAGSPEFQQRQAGLTDARFVEDLYATVLARTPDPGGRSYWLRRLSAGTSRADVVAAFAAEPESIRRTEPDVDVTIAFVGLLGRLPTDAERSTWVADLRGGRPATELYAGILGSSEYLARITP